MPFGQHVWSRIGHPLDLNPAGVPLFRNHALRTLFRNLLCLSCFAFTGFEGAVWVPCLKPHWPALGLESCWGSAVSEPCATMPNIAVLRSLPLRSWTRFAIRLLVFALYSPRRVRRLDLCATCGASMGESTCNDTLSDAKLLAAVPGDVNCPVANSAVD